MVEIDFDQIEEELELVVPIIYRMFIDAVNTKGLDLERFGIYHNTEAVLQGNTHLRANLAGSIPRWKSDYFDFRVGDGCGNYFFLLASDEEDNLVQLWAHDPAGIEKVSSGTDFFMDLIAEIEAEFKGPNQYRFQGNGSWD